MPLSRSRSLRFILQLKFSPAPRHGRPPPSFLAPMASHHRFSPAAFHPPPLTPCGFLPSRLFSAAEAANVPEECAPELLDSAPAADVVAEVPHVEGVAEGLAEVAETSSSNEAESDSLEQIVNSSTEQLNTLVAADEMKDIAHLGPAVNRLEKIIEDHKQSLDFLRAQLEDQKELIKSILNDITPLKSQSEKMIHKKPAVDTSVTFKSPSWPEWTSFLEHLRSLNYFEEQQQKLAAGGNIFDDPACLKRAFSKFSQAHETIFASLSKKDLQLLAQYGCPSDDPRTAASGKRVLNYFQAEDKGVCDPPREKPVSVHPKLSDVMRLIYTTIVNAFSGKGTPPEEVKVCIIHLLHEIVNLTAAKSGSETASDSSLKVDGNLPTLEKLEVIDEDEDGEVRMTKQGKGVKGESAKTGAKTVAQSEQWKCPRCSFLNLELKSRCVECNFRRPDGTFEIQKFDREKTQKTNDSVLSHDEDSRTPGLKKRVEDRQARKEKEVSKQDIDSSQHSDEEEDSRNVQLDSGEKKDGSGLDSDELSDDSDSDDCDIFDDIEPEDSKGTSPTSTKNNSLSDLVKKNANAFSPQKRREQGSTDRRDHSGRRDERRWKGKGTEDEHFSKPRRSSHRDDEEEDLSDEEDALPRSRRGRSDFDSREGRRSSFRGRGGRGYGGGRGGRASRGEYDDDGDGDGDDGDRYSRRGSRSYGGGRGGRGSRDHFGDDDGDNFSRRSGRSFGRGRGRSRY